MKYTSSIVLVAICILPILFSQSAYSLTATVITYLKDGIKENGKTTYKVDYNTLVDYSNASFRFQVNDKIGEKTYATNNSKVIVTDSQVFRDIVYKTPSKDNPNSYKIGTVTDSFNIESVEMIIGGQLNNYTLEPTPHEYSILYPTLTETSPTTAEFKMVTVSYD
jgi:hypothetical protein